MPEDNNNIGLFIILVLLIVIAYFLYRGSTMEMLDVNHNILLDDGFTGVPEEKNKGVEKEYRTNEFAPNFLSDMDRAGVYNLQ